MSSWIVSQIGGVTWDPPVLILAQTGGPNIWTGAGFTSRVVIGVGITILALLITTAILTVAKSFHAYRADRERKRLEEELRPAMRSLASRSEPKWEEWVTALSVTEREIVVDLLLEDVTLLSGQRKERLLDVGGVLGLEERARKELESNSHYRRLHGLKLLDAIEAPVEATWLADAISDQLTEREGAVHVLASGATDEDRYIGISVLLEGEEALSVYGVDGLHTLLAENPGPLLRYIDEYEVRNADLLSQLLLVIQTAGVTSGEGPMDGVLECIEHDDPRIRERTFHLLADYGWHSTVRDQVDVEAVLADPSVQVRSAAYRMFDEWGDDQARLFLSRAAMKEPDPRARVLIAHGLQRKAPQSLTELKAEGTISQSHRSWADIKHVIRRQPDPLR